MLAICGNGGEITPAHSVQHTPTIRASIFPNSINYIELRSRLAPLDILRKRTDIKEYVSIYSQNNQFSTNISLKLTIFNKGYYLFAGG